jgi:hypothetical protein
VHSPQTEKPKNKTFILFRTTKQHPFSLLLICGKVEFVGTAKPTKSMNTKSYFMRALGDLPMRWGRWETTSVSGNPMYCCILHQPSEPDLQSMSQVRQHQRPNVDSGHYQQSCTPSGLLGNSV